YRRPAELRHSGSVVRSGSIGGEQNLGRHPFPLSSGGDLRRGVALAFARTGQQRRDGVVDGGTAMQDRVDRRGNRHIDRETLRQQRGGSSGFHPFGDGDALAEHILELAPLPQRDAERIIARLRRGAGQDEIAETRKPHQRFGAPAFRRREPHHFREAARDEGGARIVAELASLDDAASDGEHVLDRAADLGAGHVVAEIGTESPGAERVGQHAAERSVARRQRHRGRQAARHLGGEGRAGQNGDRRRGYFRGDDLAQQRAGPGLDTLGADHQRHGGVAQRAAGGAQILRRRGEQQNLGAARHGGEIAVGADAGRERDARQELPVETVLVDRDSDLDLARPQRYVMPGAAQQRREGGAPRSRADDADAPQAFALLLAEGFRRRAADFAVLVRGVAAGAGDGADDLIAGFERETAAERRDFGQAQDRGAALAETVAEHVGRGLVQHRSHRFLFGKLDRHQRGAVHAFRRNKVPAFVEHDDTHMGVALGRGVLGRGDELLRLGQRHAFFVGELSRGRTRESDGQQSGQRRPYETRHANLPVD